jgi:hypothetical protein
MEAIIPISFKGSDKKVTSVIYKKENGFNSLENTE